jgi:hypothetical protein
MNNRGLKVLQAFKLRHKGLLICTSAEHDLVILDDFVFRLTLKQVQFPFRIGSIADNFLYFRIKRDVLAKVEMVSICV